MESVEALSRQIESRHVLFLFDSCLSGTIFRTRSGIPDSISANTAQPVRQFITAGDENQPVPDESIFRRQLEADLGDGDADLNRDGVTTGSGLGVFLRDTVTNCSRRSQTPHHGKIRDPILDKSDFVFRSPSGPVKPSRLVDPVTPPALQAGQAMQDCAELMVVGCGSFTLGSPAGEAGREEDGGPRREVNIGSAFALARTEVTVGQWKRFVTASNYSTEAERSWRSSGFTQVNDHPVVCVSWNDEQRYIAWLSGKIGQRCRLPSEAEWEYAARARSVTGQPCGDDASPARTCANGADQIIGPKGETRNTDHERSDGRWFTAPVKSYRANAWGLHDMLGNAGSRRRIAPGRTARRPATAAQRTRRVVSCVSCATAAGAATRRGCALPIEAGIRPLAGSVAPISGSPGPLFRVYPFLPSYLLRDGERMPMRGPGGRSGGAAPSGARNCPGAPARPVSRRGS